MHKGIAGSLRDARIWGRKAYDGQQASLRHKIHDGDILELHRR